MSTPADKIDAETNHPGISLHDAGEHIAGLLNEDGHVDDGAGKSRALADAEDASTRQLDGAEELDEELDTDDTEVLDDDDADDSDADDESNTADTDEESVESDSDTDEGDEDTDDSPIETLAQLAEATETDLEDLKESLTHTFNAAGEEVTVTLAELEAGYQKDADYRRSTAKLADDRRALEQDTENRLNLFRQSHTITANVIAAAHQILAADLETPAMKDLRSADPAEWAARRQEILTRVQQLEQVRHQAAADYENTANATRVSVRDANIKQLEELPTWNADTKATVRKAFESLGFSEQEVNGVMDARTVKGLLELSTLRDENAALKARIAKAEAAAKKPLRKKPVKTVKSGKGSQGSVASKDGNKGVSKDKISRLNRRLGQTHKVQDAAKVIETML